MKLFIPKDYFNDNPIPTRAFLCTTGDKRIGELQISDLSGDFKWNTYSQIDFVAHRTYTDALTGETVVNPLFDKIETPRTVFLEGYGYFIIQGLPWHRTRGSLRSSSCLVRKPPRAPQLEETPEKPPQLNFA